MRQIDTSTATAVKPTPPAAGTAKFFQDTSGSGGTVVPAWFLNSVQDEIINAITDAGLTPDKADDTQLSAAISALATTIATSSAIQYSGATVFTGSMPTSYTDLDLSGTVGANRCFVYLSAEPDTNAEIAFRVNGETKSMGYSPTWPAYFGASSGGVSSGRINYYCIITDAAGVVEWFSTAAGSGGTVIKLLAYQVLN